MPNVPEVNVPLTVLQDNSELGYQEGCFSQIFLECLYDVNAARELLKDRIVKTYDNLGSLDWLWRSPVSVRVGNNFFLFSTTQMKLKILNILNRDLDAKY